MGWNKAPNGHNVTTPTFENPRVQSCRLSSYQIRVVTTWEMNQTR